MRSIMLSLVLVTLFASAAWSQEASVVFHPGDPIHILVTFKKPSAPIEGGNFYFAAVGQPDDAQKLLNRQINGNQFHKISETEYEISGTIPEHIASGRYNLSYIQIAIAGVAKSYAAGTDFKELIVTVVNPEHPEFPALEDVKLAPHK